MPRAVLREKSITSDRLSTPETVSSRRGSNPRMERSEPEDRSTHRAVVASIERTRAHGRNGAYLRPVLGVPRFHLLHASPAESQSFPAFLARQHELNDQVPVVAGDVFRVHLQHFVPCSSCCFRQCRLRMQNNKSWYSSSTKEEKNARQRGEDHQNKVLKKQNK